MPWAERAEAGVDAKHLQAALAAKGGTGNAKYNSEALASANSSRGTTPICWAGAFDGGLT